MSQDHKAEEPNLHKKLSESFAFMAGEFTKLVLGGGNNNDSSKEETITDLVAKARDRTEQGDIEDTSNLGDIAQLLDQYKDALSKVAQKYSSKVDFSKVSPTAFLYYLEYEDEVKNPSWKRRVHRFCPGIEISRVQELNDYLDLALLSYADTVEEIRQGLERNKTPYELIYSNVKSAPAQPAHFVAIQRNQTPDKNAPLQALICVRGTKTIADAITDLLCDTEDYQGGKAHSFILASGKYLAKQHTPVLEDLCKKTGKSKVKITLVGHSLGAGAASLAGMEFKNNNMFEVEVIGFGCPALLSKDLAEKTNSFITTVINDSDMVPRTSGAAIGNLLLKVAAFDWTIYAKRDIDQVTDALNKFQPLLFNKDIVGKVSGVVNNVLDTKFAPKVSERGVPVELNEVELYPPGKCLHFFRDGSGITANYVHNTFFSEIDVTRRMIDDHVFHTGYQHILLEAVRQHKKDHHFRFDVEVDS